MWPEFVNFISSLQCKIYRFNAKIYMDALMFVNDCSINGSTHRLVTFFLITRERTQRRKLVCCTLKNCRGITLEESEKFPLILLCILCK